MDDRSAPGGGMGEGATWRPPPVPFSRVPAVWPLLMMVALVIAPMWAAMVFAELEWAGEWQGWVYGAAGGAVYLVWLVAWLSARGCAPGRLLGVQRRRYGVATGVVTVAAMIALSLGIAFSVLVPLSYVAPEFVKELLTDRMLDGDWSDPGVLAGNLSLVVAVVVLAPLLEELLFRGHLMHRWGVRWGHGTAALVSSLIFAVLHTDMVGAFVFGWVMCVAYLWTGTLWVPIALHALNNAIAVGLDLAWPEPSDNPIASLQAWWWLGPVLLAFGAVWTVWFLRRYPMPGRMTLPYFHTTPTNPASGDPGPAPVPPA